MLTDRARPSENNRQIITLLSTGSFVRSPNLISIASRRAATDHHRRRCFLGAPALHSPCQCAYISVHTPRHYIELLYIPPLVPAFTPSILLPHPIRFPLPRTQRRAGTLSALPKHCPERVAKYLRSIFVQQWASCETRPSRTYTPTYQYWDLKSPPQHFFLLLKTIRTI